MLGSYRGNFIAIAGLALAGAQQPHEHSKTSGAQDQRATSPTPEPTFRPYGGYNPDPCYNAESHDSADLCAQWRAALAAEKAAHEARRATDWAILATFLSAVGLGFLMWSLRQTEGALSEARRGNLIAQRANARATRQAIASAATAREANVISNRVAEAELRPYLFVERIDLIDVKDGSQTVEEEGQTKTVPGYLSGRVEVHLRNYGKVPARKIRVFKRSYYARFYRGRIHRFRSGTIATPVCAPGHERRVFDYLILLPNEREDFRDGVLDYVIRLRFTYEDDAGRTYSECADHRLGGDDLKTFYLLLGPHRIAKARRDWAAYELELELEKKAEEEANHDASPKEG